MKQLKVVIFVGLAVVLLPIFLACSGNDRLFRESKILMGTVVEITVGSNSETKARQSIARAFEEIERVERFASAHLADSAVSKLNTAGHGSPVRIGKELLAMLELAREISEQSSGAFDVSSGPITQLWMIDDGGRVPSKQELASSVARVGYEGIVTSKNGDEVVLEKQGMALDLGGIAKGWAVDRAVEKLEELGVRSAIVDAGGDLRLIGSRPGKERWRIGIQHPRQPGKLLVSLDLADTAVVTSGDYERFFMVGDTRYHHIFDPATGLPARGCQSVTVLARTAAEADACATAAFVLGPEKGLAFLRSRPGVRGLIVDAAGDLHWTDAALAAGSHR